MRANVTNSIERATFFADFKEQSLVATADFQLKYTKLLEPVAEPAVTVFTDRELAVVAAINDLGKNACEGVLRSVKAMMEAVMDTKLPPLDLETRKKNKLEKKKTVCLTSGVVVKTIKEGLELPVGSLAIVDSDSEGLVNPAGSFFEDNLELIGSPDNDNYLIANPEEVEEFFRQCIIIADIVGAPEYLINIYEELT